MKHFLSFFPMVELTVLRDTADHLCCGPDNSIDPPQLVVKSALSRCSTAPPRS